MPALDAAPEEGLIQMTLMIDDPPMTDRRTARLAEAGLAEAGPVRTPAFDGPGAHRAWLVAAFLLRAIALSDRDGAERDRGCAGRAGGTGQMTVPFLRGSGRPAGHGTALTHGETRVLRYLPTNLSAREIACELYVSVNTVKTHQRHLYQKLGARSRSQAVERARALGLLVPSARLRPLAGVRLPASGADHAVLEG